MRERIVGLGGTWATETGMGLPRDLPGTRIRFSVPLDGGTPNQRSIGRFSGVTDLRTR